MVRTGDRCVRVGGGKSSGKKGGGGSASSSSTPNSKASSSKKNSSIGGNPVCPRETPEWQKPITNFFQRKDHGENSNQTNKEKEVSEIQESTVTSNIKDCENEDTVNETSPGQKHVDIESKNTPTKEKSENKEARSIANSNNKLDDAIPSTSSALVESSSYKNNECKGENQDNCKTPTSDRKRKSSINILTPKRIQSHS